MCYLAKYVLSNFFVPDGLRQILDFFQEQIKNFPENLKTQPSKQIFVLTIKASSSLISALYLLLRRI
jgi:hypothetical protein